LKRNVSQKKLMLFLNLKKDVHIRIKFYIVMMTNLLILLMTKKYGKCHRDGDLPAFIHKYRQEWWKDGLLHREGDQPAVIDSTENFYKPVFRMGVERLDSGLPMYPDGPYEKWYRHGKLHREGDLPAYVSGDTQKFWFKNGVLHRD
jgi:hypothetical protein